MGSCIFPRTRAAALGVAISIGVVVLSSLIGVLQRTEGQPVATSSATFTAVEDTYVKDTSPNSNYGQRSTLEADNAPSVKRILLRFNLSGIPDGASIISGTLSMYVTNASVQAGLIHAVSGGWSEATTTWSNAPAVGTQIGQLASPAVVGSWASGGVTSSVTGNGAVDFYLVTPSSDSVSHNSSEAASNRPTLVVEWLDPTGTPLLTGIPTPTPTAASTPTATPTPTVSLDEILIFTPTDDAYVRADIPLANFGLATSLQVDGSPQKDFLLKFTVTGLNERQPTSAKLRLYAMDPSGKGGDFHRAADATWSETTVTWNDAPAGDAAVIASLGSVSVNTWYEIDLASLVRGDGIVSLRVTSTSSNGADYSSSDGAAQFAPQLVVSAPRTGEAPTPTPTSTPIPTPGPDPVFVGAGDIASCSSTGDEASANLLDAIPGTVFTLGDNAYPDATDAQFANCYGPSWGRHKARTQPSAGNHEYQTLGASGYFNYFGAAAGDPSRGYYSYNLGAWHIIALNSNCLQVGGCDAGSPQEQWLRNDLAANRATCTLAYWHHPRFSSGRSGNLSSMKPFWQALYDYDADVVLVGHDHDYERFAPQDPSGNLDLAKGIVEFVAGTGGASHGVAGTLKPNSQVFNNDAFGVLKLVLHPTSYDWEFVPEAGRTFTDSGSANCVTTTASQQQTNLLENVPSATGYRYGAKDDQGNSMDTLKIIENPQGGYLGVYHALVNGVFQTKVATSTDLLSWTYRADLDAHASQATLARLSDDGYLVAYEKDSASENWVRFRYYADLASLLAGSFQEEFDAPRTLAPSAEGTPNIYSALLAPDIQHSQIDVGFHYFRDADVDRQARGTLTNFSSWTTGAETHLNQLFEALGTQGNVGDRDYTVFRGKEFNVHEGQLVQGDWASWRVYLYDYELDSVGALNVRTHGGSTAFGNPTFTNITSPNGRPAVVVTYFVFAQGAAAGEAGELIFYREY